MFKNYFITTLRSIARNKVSTFVGILGFTVGLIYTVFIFHFVKNEIAYDKYFPEYEKVYRVLANFNKDKFDAVALPVADRLQAQFPQVTLSTHYIEKECNVKVAGNFFKKQVQYVDKDFFTMFSRKAVAGSWSEFDIIPNSTLINQSTAVLLFGNINPVGKVISVETSDKLIDYRVDGVLEDDPTNSSLRTVIVLPFQNYREKILTQLKNDWLINQFAAGFYVKLENPKSKTIIEEKLRAVLKSNIPSEYLKIYKYELQPISEMHFDNDVLFNKVNASNKNYMFILMGLALLIILIVSINYINLVTAKSFYRFKEIAVRKTFGARRKNIILQFMMESFVIVFIAFLTATLIMPLMLPFINSLLDQKTKMDIGGNISTVMLILMVMLVAVVVGLIPAIKISKYSPQIILRGFKAVENTKHLSKIFIGLQLAIAIFLLFSAIILNMQFKFIAQKNLGYDKNLIVMIKTNELFGRHLNGEAVNNYLDDILSDAKVQSATAGNLVLGGKDIDFLSRFDYEDKSTASYIFNADRRLLGTLQLKLIAGKDFSDFNSNANSIIVNEEFVKKLNIAKPIDCDIVYPFGKDKSKHVKIIGVVKNFFYRSLRDSIAPVVFVCPDDRTYSECIYVKIGNTSVHGAIETLKEKWQKYFPDQAFDYQFLDERIDHLYKNEVRWKNLINYSSASAVIFVCIGLFGIVYYSAERRTKEIGIRKVLGASVLNIVVSFLKEYINILTIAFLIAIFPAYYLSIQWLQDYAYRIEPGLFVFVLTAVIIFSITLLTVTYHAVKAAMANPVDSLKYE
jgi:putative ABC transport system permease protein